MKNLAVKLGHPIPPLMDGLRQKLQANRLSHPLFDTARCLQGDRGGLYKACGKGCARASRRQGFSVEN